MIKKKSYFKNQPDHKLWFESWITELEKMNGRQYERLSIETSLGNTAVYGINTSSHELPAFLIFPGFRTTSLIWDLDNGLDMLSKNFRVYLVETNGQPNLSDGNSPSIKSLEYGKWGEEIFNALSIDKAFIAGASFGGLVCMKISIVIPDRIKAAFLLNPACFRLVSLQPKNLYYNFLPIISTSKKNIQKFLNQVIFDKPNHQLSEKGEQHLIEYLEYVLLNYKDNTEKPYYMGKQLNTVKVETYLFQGTRDILIPFEKSERRARKHLNNNLKEVHTASTGHGIETHRPTLDHICEIAKKYY
ncbi:MAG: alpha/beta hydrolase [Crocinitomicaceae bacterium]|nr:alpha/beta hydrolase [Crocinitomicaceae bacterium]